MRRGLFLMLFLSLALFRKTRGAVSGYTLQRGTNESVPGPYLLFNTKLNSGTALEFYFKTFDENALVLYQDDHGFSNYMEIILQDGRLTIVYNIGDKKYKNSSRYKYNDFTWHSVKIQRTSGTVSLILRNERIVFNTSNQGPSNFKVPLQIGGFPPNRYLNPNIITSHGTLFFFYGGVWHGNFNPPPKRFFNACIKNIRYTRLGKNTAQTIRPYKSKYSSHGCQLTKCDNPVPVCENNGKCIMMKNKEVRCDCRWTGYEGDKCTRPSLELTLNGTYRVAYSWENNPTFSDGETFKFRIRTKQQQAWILEKPAFGQSADKLIFKLRNGRLIVIVNLGCSEGCGSKHDAVLQLPEMISDGRWHVIEYTRKKRQSKFSVIIDNDEKTRKSKYASNEDFVRFDYISDIHLGEIADTRYRHSVVIQDFIWRCVQDDMTRELNFVTGLFKWYHNQSKGGNYKYIVTPRDILPQFNRKLPVVITRKPNGGKTPYTARPTIDLSDQPCIEGGELCDPKGLTTLQPNLKPGKSASTGDDDDSSLTWIVVVTVICSLILFAVIAFLVYRWNKRYSGDFQITKKEIGPSGTVVHYKDTCYKEKRRPSKI